MSAPLAWYFDVISPFAYLQWKRLRRDHPDVTLAPRPVLLAGLLNHFGQLGPAEIPGKRRHTYRMALWQAREAGIRLQFPPAHPFNPLAALRLCIAAPDRVEAVDRILDHIWKHGQAGDSIDALDAVARALGIDDPARAVASEAVKRELQANGEQAIALQIFGVPTLRVGNENFWGNDATAFALAYRDAPDMLQDAQMQRLDALPQAVQRRRSTA